ncbi:tRNA lysidine(34) synthetase TilS [Saxibacter everestensis]|uniref:tRNA(Ile)-lysidine synthase n=1 Tax=Saxibacter everestensis TaxID=2909229 RepID=A0ABY8QPV2_9MICO|nr:tRNA lysidine(34) synthetase TilS [Brevibacteriaceae bacterium ZFBP1038]
MSERRPRLDPAVARIRNEVVASLGLLDAQSGLIIVACSGGPDSMALASAAAFALPRRGFEVCAVIIDHGLQPQSREVADRTAAQLLDRGIAASVRSVVTEVGGQGVEDAARQARYAALAATAQETGAVAVMLGHTLDDQAETVLLGLARGSGARSLAGMRARRGLFVRPLLAVRRAETVRSCEAEGLTPWHDPMNDDRAYLRVRVRHEVLPLLEQELGPGVAGALARTASQLADDSALLDEQADRLFRDAAVPGTRTETAMLAATLAEAPPALRRRALRLGVLAAGAPGSGLTFEHLVATERLLGKSNAPAAISLPGGLAARRRGNQLVIGRADCTDQGIVWQP